MNPPHIKPNQDEEAVPSFDFEAEYTKASDEARKKLQEATTEIIRKKVENVIDKALEDEIDEKYSTEWNNR